MKSYLIFLLLSIGSYAFSQPTVTISIKNQHIDGDDFYFDIYIKSDNEDLLLENCDFVLSFNTVNFSGASLSKVGPSPGFCTFNPVNYPSSDDVREEYYDGTAAGIINGTYLVVNVSAPTPSDQAAFDKNVARINNSDNQCLGRFRLSTISNHSGTAGLFWKMTGNPQTSIYSFENAAGFQGSQVTNVIGENPFDALLPIELTSFEGFTVDQNRIKLVWTTASENNNEFFEVQKSNNLLQWQNIGKLPGSGNSSSVKQYCFIDKLPFSGLNYYRIRQVDFDGTDSFSSIINLNIDSKNINIFPNPVRNYLNINLAPGTPYYISNNSGAVVREGILTNPKIDMSELSTGTYYFLTTEDQFKFIKL